MAFQETFEMINFIQVNLNGNWGAQQLLDQTVTQKDTDIVILSEPYVRTDVGDRLLFSLDRKAAVGTTTGANFVHEGGGSGVGFAWIKVHDLVVFSCYWSPATSIGEYEMFLGDLESSIRDRGEVRLVIGGDFNAWNVEWGSRCNNPRGEILSDFAASLGLVLANTGNTPTFVRGEATSIIDVTFARRAEITDWEVLDDINLSDRAPTSRSGSICSGRPLNTDGLRPLHEAPSIRDGL